MAYAPQQNELVMSCKGVEGGSIGSLSFALIDTPVIFGVHGTNIWVEVEGVIGFSIDKDIAMALLKKIAEQEIPVLEKEMD